MARTKIKWKFAFFTYLILVNVCTKSLPISTILPALTTSDTVFKHSDVPAIETAVSSFRDRVAAIAEHESLDAITDKTNALTTELLATDNHTIFTDENSTHIFNTTRNTLLRNVRPGQEIRQYAIELTVNGNTFSGRAVIDVVLQFETREDPIVLHVEGLTIQSVLAGVFTETNAVPADFDVDDGLLEIEPTIVASSYIIIVQYTGSMTTIGRGLYRGSYGDFNYLAMNLHPTHARRVFPCMDEPTEASIISFTFNGLDYTNVMTNSMQEDNQQNQFRALQGPPHLWSLAAHNLITISGPTSGVLLFIRPDVTNQESQASVAINYYYNNLVEWTNKSYFDIVVNQAPQLRILALPDVSRDWYGLSTVALWEPHILMENICSVKQRYTALQKMAVALSKQWFGNVVYPENWRYQWVTSGLATYAAFSVLRDFQNDVTGLDISLLDVNTLFVTEVIQESLYRDGYASARTLELSQDLFEEDEIRDYIYGIHEYKAPAILWMLRLILGDENQDFIQTAGRTLLAGRLYQAQVRSCMEYCSHLWERSAKYQLEMLKSIEKSTKRLISDELLVKAKLQSLEHRRKVASLSVFYRLHFGEALQTVNYLNLVDAINADWIQNGNGRIDEVDEYLEPWLENNGCPLIHIGLRQGGVLATQERVGFSAQPHVPYNLPITFSVSTNPNFENIYPIAMMEGTMTFNMLLDEEEGDYVLFNIQGQGYYRVNYDNDLWERIIDALDDPDSRAAIHPLNRATLVDDALNLARAGRIDYEIAFNVALTMEHETEYAPWKAFIRNMNFLRKRLEALVWDDEDYDPDIYLRMVRRTIGSFETQIGFSPDPLITEPAMTSLTRGLVMDHACRAGYQPCIAAAVDWFYDANNNDVVNPNIPRDIRPAVYCTMVREGGSNVIDALYARLDIEPSLWERVVILESLTCSSDTSFVSNLLEETLAVNSIYSTEEKIKIFIAAAESNAQNARVALNFLSLRVNEIRNIYGGEERLEEIINSLAENMADADLSADFNVWVYAQNNNLDDSQVPAERVAAVVAENQAWDIIHLDYVYEWIDENDAPTLVVSLLLLTISCLIGFFNH